MKGKKLSMEEVLDLKNGTKVILDTNNDKNILCIKDDSILKVMNGCGIYSISEELWREYSRQAYEYEEDVEMGNYKGWEILKMIDEGELKPGDKIIANNMFEFYVSATGTLRYISDGKEVYSSYLNNINRYTIVETKPVSFMEAAKAFNEGRVVKCEYNGFTDGEHQVKIFRHGLDTRSMKEDDDLTFYMALKGKWFIED